MDILIKNMEMPNMCYPYCPFCDDRGDYPLCIITGTQKGYMFIEENTRMEDCPLIPVPEHGDLIDRDTFIKEHEDGFVEQIMKGGDAIGIRIIPMRDVIKALNNAEVVLERTT